MDAGVLSAALKQHVVAIASPGLGKRSLNDRVTVTLPAALGMGDDVFEEPMSTAAAQKIWRGDEHAGCCDSGF
jgi:hypothetical protein